MKIKRRAFKIFFINEYFLLLQLQKIYKHIFKKNLFWFFGYFMIFKKSNK